MDPLADAQKADGGKLRSNTVDRNVFDKDKAVNLVPDLARKIEEPGA